MTASKLEESIEKLAAKIVGVDRGSLPDALRAFAEAVREPEIQNVRHTCGNIEHLVGCHCDSVDVPVPYPSDECEHPRVWMRCPDCKEEFGGMQTKPPEPKECVETHRVKLEFDLTNGVLENVKTAKADVIRRFYPPHIDTPKECGCKGWITPRECHLDKPPAAIPDEVSAEIGAMMRSYASKYKECFDHLELEDFARFCLSVAGRGRG